jgi:hypothetical protein
MQVIHVLNGDGYRRDSLGVNQKVKERKHV